MLCDAFVLAIRSKSDERFRTQNDKRIIASSICVSRRYCSWGCFLPPMCKYLNITHTQESAIQHQRIYRSMLIVSCVLLYLSSTMHCWYIFNVFNIILLIHHHLLYNSYQPFTAIYLKHIIEYETFISCVPKIIHKLVVLILWNYTVTRRERVFYLSSLTFSPISQYKSLFRPTFSPEKIV